MLASVKQLIQKVLRTKRKQAENASQEENVSTTTTTTTTTTPPAHVDQHKWMAEVLRRGQTEFEEKWQQTVTPSMRLSDVEIVKTLGYGKFGRVMLVRLLQRVKRQPQQHPLAPFGEYAAMKVMSKRVVLAKSTVACVLFEKKILQTTSFPFLVRYRDHFKDNANLYLVLEYVAGGDMFTHLRRAYRFEDTAARFYIAQITLSLEYLHHLGIVHRDLKPENVMLAADGFLKIADFGLAKRIGPQGRTATKCGTRVYMAPELLAMRRIYYSFGVDWWALGVMAYEMTVGRTPYEAAHPMELLYKIKRRQIRYPAYMHDDAVQLVHGLLEPDLRHRLVTTHDIKAQPYFHSTDWLRLYHKKVQPPFVPTIRSARDTNNFEPTTEESIEEWTEDVFYEEFQDF